VNVGNTKYIAGVCNIGTEEVRRRKIIGYTGLIITILITGILAATPWPPSFGFLIVVVSATVSSYGLLQAHAKFCVVYGFAGVFNFGSVGESSKVTDRNARRADLKRAFQINALAIGIGITYGGILYYLLR
jgi:hypothetical protein